ncbi:DTW domain protein [Dictyocaulus viviparus]|uniref:tRNA-uridine aminocarboxypropyltransferase 1 n=1 Tax=Dictyocaulus viviparus TaxID=29172 RepID=A0A0D8XYR3_DICVI|nr:DTW domain protein [Dictyocaulus viviparus]
MSVITRNNCNLSSYSPLQGLHKQMCTICGRKRKYFCYDCRVLLPGVFSPFVKVCETMTPAKFLLTDSKNIKGILPCAVDVIKHPMEKNSKSSAIHCKIVAPDQTRIFDLPNVVEYNKEEKQKGGGSDVLVFASPSAVSIEEFVMTFGPIKRFIILDCTWFQVNTMLKIPQIQGIPCVSLTKYHTAFWRPQHNVDKCSLATIEAIYYALKEYQEYGLKLPYKGEFDDLLYWFFHTQHHIEKKQVEYSKRKLRDTEMMSDSL